MASSIPQSGIYITEAPQPGNPRNQQLPGLPAPAAPSVSRQCYTFGLPRDFGGKLARPVDPLIAKMNEWLKTKFLPRRRELRARFPQAGGGLTVAQVEAHLSGKPIPGPNVVNIRPNPKYPEEEPLHLQAAREKTRELQEKALLAIAEKEVQNQNPNPKRRRVTFNI